MGVNENAEHGQDQGQPKPRKQRIDRGEARTTDRDLMAMQWLAEQWAAPVDQIGRLLRPDAPWQNRTYTAAAAVQRWRRHGWVDIARVQQGADRWVWPKPFMSTRMLGWDVQSWTPSPARVHHMEAVNDVRLRHPYGWTSERVLLHQVGFRGDETGVRVPDGLVQLGGQVGGRTLLVEVELSRKSPEAMRAAMQGWPAACDRWGADGVLWVSTPSLHSHMRAALDAVTAQFPSGVGAQLAELAVVWQKRDDETAGVGLSAISRLGQLPDFDGTLDRIGEAP